jgi:hypothetical protein
LPKGVTLRYSTLELSSLSFRDEASHHASIEFGAQDASGNSIAQQPNGTTVPDAGLLFSGDYKRSGLDLVISGPVQKFTVGNYFKGEHHRALFSPDGASLSGDVVDALARQTDYAQADPAARASIPIGHVVKLIGNANVIRNGVSISLNIGDNVFKGDVVQSGSDSALGLSFIDGTAFGLSANARMVLNEMIYDPNGSSNSSLISLVQGTISFVAGETAKHGNMKIDTPVATMGIRGTAVLVEIAADNGPTKFSVLVEPGQVTGSFVLLDRTTGATLGNVSQAGLMTLVTPTGQNQLTISEQAKTLADLQSEKDVVQLVFSIAFPSFNQNDSKPHSTGSIGSGLTPFENLAFLPLGSFPAPEAVKSIGTTATTTTSFSPADIFIHHLAEVTVSNVTGFQSSVTEEKNFAIASQVSISDPITSDTIVPFVSGSAKIVGAVGPVSIPPGFDLLSLVSVDPTTGVVSYDPRNFRFLAANESAQYVINFESQVGDSILPETLLLTINGLDDPPILVNSDAHISLSAIAGKTGSSDPLTQPGTLSFRDVDLSDIGSSYPVTILHTAVSGTTTGLPHDPAALDAILRSYFTPSVLKDAGSTDGVFTETFSAPDKVFDYLAAGETVTLTYTVQIGNVAGASSTATFTVTITGVDHAPSLAPDTVAVHPVIKQPSNDSMVDTASGSLAFVDPVLSDTHIASVAFVSDQVSGGGTLPAAALAILQSAIAAGIATDSTESGSGTLVWNFSAPDHLFDFLRAGQTLTLTYDLTLSSDNGGIATGQSATQPITIIVTGVNNTPQIVGETNPALLIVQHVHPANPDVLPIGTNTNSLGLPTETFDSQNAGPASNNGTGFGTFFSQALNANFSGSGAAGIVNGSSGVSSAPDFANGPDTTNYLSVGTTGTETIDFNTMQNAFGLFWGSVNPQNTIEFFNGTTLVASYSGADLSPRVGNYYVQFFDLSPFDKVVIHSNQAFEIDNVSAGFIPSGSAQPIEPLKGTLTATDADVGDTMTASVTGPATIEYNGSTTLPDNVDISKLIAASAISFDSVTTTGGADLLNWVYNPGSAVDFLKSGDVLTITYNAQVNDGAGNVGGQPLTITIIGDSGSVSIANGAVMELGDVVGVGEAITFQGSTGVLVIDNASHFTGTISGFTGNGTLAGSDQIDLKNINFNSSSFSSSFANDTLSLTDGTHSTSFQFNGSYSSANFSFVSDGHGGTIIYDPPAQNVNAAAAVGTRTTNATVAFSNQNPGSNDNNAAFKFSFGAGNDTVTHVDSAIDGLQFGSRAWPMATAGVGASYMEVHETVTAPDPHNPIELAAILGAKLSSLHFHIA